MTTAFQLVRTIWAIIMIGLVVYLLGDELISRSKR